MSYKVKSVYANSSSIYEALGSVFILLHEQIINDFVTQGLVEENPETNVDADLQQYIVIRNATSLEAANQYVAALQEFFTDHPEVTTYQGSEVISE